MTIHSATVDSAPRRQSWSRGFAAASLVAVWGIAFWTYVFVQNAGSGHMRGFGMVPLGLGVIGSIFALQASDDLAWRLRRTTRQVLVGSVSGGAAVLWAPVVLGVVLSVLGR